jgi:CHAD domain-containing protein
MADQLRPTEAGTKGVCRLVRKQVGKALEALQGRPPSDEAVHDARKRLKKARAWLRLLRDAVGARRYRQENTTLRDAARPLTEVRDAKVLVDTLDVLAGRAATELEETVREVGQALLDDQRDVRQRVLNGPDALSSVRTALDAARERLGDYPVDRRGWSVLGVGLRSVYRAGRDAFRAAREEPSVENLHEWRKQAKSLRHQLEVLRPIAPAVLEALADQAHALGDLLGDDHDLAVLHEKLDAQRARFSDPEAVTALLALIDRRRQELWREAWPLGDRLYTVRPKQFVARLADYWHAWRSRTAARA